MVGEKKGRPRSRASPPPANYRAHIKHQAGDGGAAAKVFICIKRLSTYIIGIIIKKGNLKRKLHIMAHCTSVAHVFRQLWPPGAVLCFSLLHATEGLQLLCPVLSSYLFFTVGYPLQKSEFEAQVLFFAHFSDTALKGDAAQVLSAPRPCNSELQIPPKRH